MVDYTLYSMIYLAAVEALGHRFLFFSVLNLLVVMTTRTATLDQRHTHGH